MNSNNPTRIAWVVLLGAFLVFCALAAAIPLAARWYLLHAQVSRPAILQVTAGTVLVVTPSSDEPIAVVDRREIEPGTLVQTDQRSQATLVFPANGELSSPDLATVQIYTDTQLRLLESSRPRFSLSEDADRISLEVMSGRARVNTTDLQPRGLQTETRLPQATAYLGPGSFSVAVTNELAQVASRFGQAQVDATGVRVELSDEERTVIVTGEPPGAPGPMPENLIANGDFQLPLGPPDWLVTHYPEGDPTAGTTEMVEVGGREAVRFQRINQPPTHTETGITQILDRNVQDYDSLNLQMDVLLRWQSLGGAGEQSSEFPLMFWLDYVDIYGNHQFWTHGFYYRDPPEQWVVTGGEKIQANIWFPFESGNLLERLPMEGRPPPDHINWLRVYASGHNYDSLVSEVRLIAR